MKITERFPEGLGTRTVSYRQLFKEDNPDWNRFWGYRPSPENPHEFGECMEDWHDYEWRKEQKEIDLKRELAEKDKWIMKSFYPTASTAYEGNQIQAFGI